MIWQTRFSCASLKSSVYTFASNFLSFLWKTESEECLSSSMLLFLGGMELTGGEKRTAAVFALLVLHFSCNLKIKQNKNKNLATFEIRYW